MRIGEECLLKMDAVLEYKDEKLSGFGFGIAVDVSLDSDKGVFRRYHVGNSPLNWIDPWGLKIDWTTIALGSIAPRPLGAILNHGGSLGLSPSDSIIGAIEGTVHGWTSGYYRCYAKCMGVPVGWTVGELTVEYLLETRGYTKIAKVLGVVTWVMLIRDNAKCVKECSKCL